MSLEEALHRIVVKADFSFEEYLDPLVAGDDLEPARRLLAALAEEIARQKAAGVSTQDASYQCPTTAQRRLELLLRRRLGIEGLEIILQHAEDLWTADHFIEFTARDAVMLQEPANLCSLIERYGVDRRYQEFLARLVDKMVARGFDGRKHMATEALWRRLGAAGHPLAEMPLFMPMTADGIIDRALRQPHWDLSFLDAPIDQGLHDLILRLAKRLRQDLRDLEARIPGPRRLWGLDEKHKAEKQAHNRLGHALDRLEVALCLTPDPAHPRLVLETFTTYDPAEEALRKKAAQLATGQSFQTLQAFVESCLRDRTPADRDSPPRDRRLELCALLIHETVVRGLDWRGDDSATRFRARLGGLGHPLAPLPLARLDLEHGAERFLTQFSKGGAGFPYAYPYTGTDDFDPPRESSRPEPVLVEATTPEDVSRIGSAVELWVEHSNGRVEARLFLAEDQLRDEDVSPRLLLTLGLECLAGATESEVYIKAIPAATAFDVLFSMAGNGGDYGGASYGAYGRLRAWKSLAGLLGTTAEDIEALARTVAGCEFKFFIAKTDWFFKVINDVGLTCYCPATGSLAVLAVTDTD